MNPHQLQESSSQSGFTIIESLVAILVVSILLVAIAPVLVISTATRVQARRVELATEAAQAFIDAIKSKTISEAQVSTTTSLAAATADAPRTVSDTSTSGDYLLSSAAVPTAITSLYCFHKDGKITLPTDCTTYKTTSPVQFYIQAFGKAVGTISTSTAQIDNGQSYRLGVRVYRSDAFIDSGNLKKSSDTNAKKTATFSGGLGDRKAPLVEITTEIVRGQPSYNALCERLGGCQD
ncbi:MULTISPECIES: hormogonium polysaccharide secretion pseudopilin HpsB [Nostoc]|uniref:Prepilin-type N-terminal cleavage/methylation domain-containing protein n=1 Tax=Nostoc paludosum FACHB-159 TaxID=2692908 RepID=A0ABR8KDB6_9NOSO|nr:MULTISPECIES: hormogonium polysaccharide secretion pseudopilin HpsB [Nostoc]MBD2679909.1 prepilin-type N-terminal cleavage/methylation domain-containing protein [Nostoc sp. FACHB-857]MBD2736163.1 prepilin-type N-terminal cleavage/methylation domain-containing protein [Nostoc paludosum FACHB-159]